MAHLYELALIQSEPISMMRSIRKLTCGFWLFAGCCVSIHAAALTAIAADSSQDQRLVRTTAYTHSRHTGKTANDSKLRTGDLNSAAADWSRFPFGTKFTIVPTNKTYIVDDYGPALVGTNKIDLYMPSRQEMTHWGVRKVKIYIIERGSYDRSLALLKSRRKVPYIRKMVKVLEEKVQASRKSAQSGGLVWEGQMDRAKN
jgi:3D (Asp-Asp-Asp) domain-containing protein